MNNGGAALIEIKPMIIPNPPSDYWSNLYYPWSLTTGRKFDYFQTNYGAGSFWRLIYYASCSFGPRYWGQLEDGTWHLFT